MKAIYYYIFYQIHKLFDQEIFQYIGASILAKSILIIVEVWLLMILLRYSNLIKSLLLGNRYLDITLILLIGIITLFNLVIFHEEGEWNIYYEKFDELPVWINRIGGIIISLSITLVVLNSIIIFKT